MGEDPIEHHVGQLVGGERGRLAERGEGDSEGEEADKGVALSASIRSPPECSDSSAIMARR